MSDQDAQVLYQQGLELLSQDERSKAVDVLKRAVEQDSENVDIWVALAQALDDVAEKRIALTTILQLDPENTYAQDELSQTEKPKADSKADEEIVLGITRRDAQRYGIGLVAFTVVILLITTSFTGSQNAQRDNARRAVAQEISNATATTDAATRIAETVFFEETERALELTAVQEAQVSPTPTATATRTRSDTLPTPLPSASETPTTLPLRILPAPTGYVGRIFAWGGVNPSGRDGLRLRQYQLPTGELTQLNDDFAQDVTVEGRGQRLVYMKVVQSNLVLTLMNTQSPSSEFTTELSGSLVAAGASDPRSPRLSPDGTTMVLIGTSPQGSPAVFLHTFNPSQTIRVTFDDAEYTSATVYGSSVIAVRRDANGTDLVLVDLSDPATGFPQTRLTSDGDTLIEAFPTFSPDGQLVMYNVTAGNPNDNDIYIARILPNLFTSEALVTTANDEISPSFSPDGNAIVYSSNANGTYNIFIFDRTTRQTYQLTADAQPVYAGGWGG